MRHGDNEWGDIVFWTLTGLVAAEEFGVTSANVTELAAAPTDNPQLNRMLGTSGDFGPMIGLSTTGLVNVIAAVGNYGEIFEQNIGGTRPWVWHAASNALWTEGGLQYAMPFN